MLFRRNKTSAQRKPETKGMEKDASSVHAKVKIISDKINMKVKSITQETE